MPKTPAPAKPVAYSYVRFSSAEQAKGDSVRRQEELRDAWLAKSGAILDTALTLRDEGKSAYTGSHRQNPDRNALASFLELVRRERIPRGSYLIVESLDRLTREHIRPALTLLLNLIESGIRIVQLLPAEAVFDEQVEPMALMMAIMELSRGHSESRMKSERIGRGWAARKSKVRAGGVVATRNVPGWLRVEGGKVVAVPERVKVVRRLFAMAGAGHSMVSICRALNTERVGTFGRSGRWNPSTVQKILRGREVLGEFQPGRMAVVERARSGKAVRVRARVPDGDPIAGYYPAVVEEAAWFAAQAAVGSRHSGGRKPSGGAWNPFAGLLRDARDGGLLYLLHQGKARVAAYASYNAAKGVPGAKYASFPAGPFITEVLRRLREIDPREILDGAGPDEQEVLTLEAKLARAESRIAALQAELEGGEGEVRTVVNSLRRMEAERDQFAEDLARARARAASPLSAAWAESRTLIDALESSPDAEETRTRVRSAVRRVTEDVYCLFVGVRGRGRLAAVQVNFKGGVRRHYLLAHRPAVRNQHSGGRPAESFAKSFADAGLPDLDLRDRKHARELERDLSKAAAELSHL